MKQTRTQVAGIELLEVLNDDSEIGIVLLHGYGASMHDLFPLWELWHEKNFSWYFPNGVLPLNMGPYGGRAWFSIDMAKLEEAMRLGKHREMKNSVPPEFDSTMAQLKKLVIELSTRHKKIIIGGFSQGAMCTSHLALMEDLKIDGVILLSGVLMAEEKLPTQATGLPFYQSHGTRDPVLSLAGAKDLETSLKKFGFSGELYSFDGGHEIPSSVIGGVKTFLRSFL